MQEKIDGVLLASGGMDSTVMAYWLKSEKINFIPLFINYGQHCVEKELETLERLLPEEYIDKVNIVNLSDVYKGVKSRLIREANLWEDKITKDDMYLPYRNILFLTTAAAFAQSRGIKKIYSAFINSNHATEIDCSLEFFNRLGNLIFDYGCVKIEMPFRHFSKSDVAKLGIKLNVPIAQTYSCQTNSQNHCGACPNCIDRINALDSLFIGSDSENGGKP